MRRGDINEMHEELLKSRIGQRPDEGVVITKLYSHNVDVDSINNRELAALTSHKHTYRMETSGQKAKVEQFVKTLLAPEELTLAEGAEVMFVVNDYAHGFANGTRGRVVDFAHGQPVVQLQNGREVVVESHDWTLTEDGKTRATATQLPLRLAWAITIHKSQGMSLDGAYMDLSRSFTPGMGYVALSRVRSIGGVYLVGINNMALQLHPHIFEFDSELRQLSEALANITEDAPEQDDAPEPETPEPDQVLLAKLKLWRSQRAAKEGKPAYIVAHDSTLETLATYPPHSPQELRATKGFGPKKSEQYGDDILAIINQHQ
jgi:ATP-dependent exoDNAse (exonuclease V) alpha subunit